jgi:TRAP-type C4-dicarboxylate transport system substrate-binding protein
MPRVFILVLAAVFAALPLAAQQHTIKFATLAPDGSTWIKVMREFDAALRAETGGKVGFKLYPGGVAGDEKDVIRKIRLGQYNGGGFTGVGIGEVAKKLRILDSPLLFKGYDEVDYILQKYDGDFRQALADGGFVLLGWAEVGFIYVFSQKRVTSFDDLRNVKAWMWEGDPIAGAAYQAIGVSPIQLSPTDVMSSLQTGMIDTVYSSPYALIALQWFTRVHYAMSQPLGDAMGAAIVSKKLFDSLPSDVQQILLADSKKYLGKITQASRQDNARAIDTLKERSIQFIQAPPDIAAKFPEVGERGRKLLAGNLYSKEFLSDVEESLQSYRQSHPAAK